MAAQKLRKWAMLADFLVHFAGRCSDLDVYGLYALSRVGDVAKFQRVLSVAKLLRSQIDELVTTIKRETFCIPLSATFVAVRAVNPHRAPVESGLQKSCSRRRRQSRGKGDVKCGCHLRRRRRLHQHHQHHH